ncbi:HAMP domain-containing histidine kinase [candidate division KSB1 bacterium]|nr:HAMP domain-containing histidine kinase [candidate division KSB1 bacterium]NIR72530.1 HAMP domain-containing histidine kinase [candidate division KSB1 bacterium]NIS23829.1 HAMP domain-containing histidine kinase [candidate division KSB1 bacterium]NIT70756.1 HAMP domain-containing histidine kinase [candidate division KSB1 bacterium]NIU24271.1 HAMP domain-containing histidine kinase [candidate division KSB1 bacterium]
MKLVHKQLTLLFLAFGTLFGVTLYFTYWGLNQSIDILSHQSAELVISSLRPRIENSLKGVTLGQKLNSSQKKTLRRILLNALSDFNNVEEFLLVHENGRVYFELNGTVEDSVYSLKSFGNDSDGKMDKFPKVQKLDTAGAMDAVWNLENLNYFGVLRINPKSGSLKPILHRLTVNFYLIGFSGIVGVILLSLFGRRILKSPVKRVEKAMTVLDKRKYGYRLKWKSGDEFAELYQKVNQALRRLEQLDSVQRNAVQRKNAVLREMKTISRFLDIMSHEIKNPLHALGINLDVLKTKINKRQSKESTLKHIEMLEHEIDHVQEVVLGFLNYVRPGIPKKEPTNVNEMVKEVCQMVSAEAEQAKIRIETRLGRNLRQIMVDRGQFKQALHNVVINAIHATGKGGKINIRSWSKRNKVLLAVKDTGTGISKEELEKICDLYYTTKKGGSGLGLPITKRIIEANSGEFRIDSTVGKGTEATFIFPTK